MPKFSITSEKVVLHADLFDVNEIQIVKESGEQEQDDTEDIQVIITPIKDVITMAIRDEIAVSSSNTGIFLL